MNSAIASIERSASGLIYEPRVTLGALSSSELLLASAIPEPGSTGLLLMALSVLAFRRRH
ncbi:MAG: PEP-CTERM sorting domain-containing protein [Akkermansiaceae bacterium]